MKKIIVLGLCVAMFGMGTGEALAYGYYPYQQYMPQYGYQSYSYVPQQNMAWGYRYTQPQMNDSFAPSFYGPQYTSYGYCLPVPSTFGSGFCMY